MRSIRLSEAARIYSGNSINERVKAQNYMGLNEGTPYIATKDISYGFLVSYENGVKIPHSKSVEFKLAKKGSVLLCAEGGSAGRKMAIIDRDVFFVNKLFCFECDAQLNSRYLFYYLQTSIFQDLFKNSITGIIGGVSLEKVRNLPMILPSLEKQREIVEKLDKAFAEIDLLERNLELSEENTNELSRSFLSSMFAQSNHLGSPEDSSTNRGRAENLFKLSEIFRVGSSKRVLKADWKESGIPFYRGREITRLSKTGIADNELFISESHFKELSSNYGVPIVGDIMVTAIGTIGNTYIVKESDCFYFKDASVLWLHKQSDVNSHFIDYWLKSDLFFEQLDKGNGATVDTLTIEKLSNVKILLPSREKQIEVVEKLDRAFEEIELLKEQIKMEKDHAAALRQSLLSSAFSQEEAVA